MSAPYILNTHPVDELAALREEIKILEAREAQLRASLLNGNDDDRDGKTHRAFVLFSNRETVDKTAMIAALGRDVIAPFLKTTAIKTLKVVPKDEAK